MQRHIGLESLIQRGRSPLFDQLVGVFKDSQSALVDRPRASDNDIWMTLKKIKFAERVTAILTKEMGPVFKPTKVEIDSAVNMYCAMTMTDEFGKRLKNKNTTPGMMMQEINRFYDDRTAKVTLPSDFKRGYDFQIVLTTALWSLRNPDNSFHLTAEELVAVTLHEVGHVDQMIQEAVRVFAQTLDASDIVDYAATSGDRDVILALIANLRKSRALDKSWRKTLDVAEQYFKTSNALDDPSYYEALDTVSLAVIKDVSARTLLVFDHSLMGLGRSRVATRLQGRVDMERSADEFSARSGAYSALVSALGKIYATQDVTSDLVYRKYLPSAAAVAVKLLQSAAMILIPLEDISMGYDSVVRRMRMIVETGKHAFHDDKLPSGVKAYIQQQIAEAESYIQNYEAHPHHKTRVKIKSWLDGIGKFGRVLKSPFHNRLSENYERLQDANRSLSRHALYYLANK